MTKLLPVWSNLFPRLAMLAAFSCLFAPLAAQAQGRDVVQFGNDIVVRGGEDVHDAVCFLCSIEIDGTVNGDTVAFLGNIRVRGHAQHDAVAFLGNVSLGEGASIERDVVVFAGNLRIGPGATVGNNRVVFPFVLFLMPFLMVAAFVGLIVWGIRALVYRNRPVYPMPPPRF